MQKVGVSRKFLFFLLLLPSIGFAQYANDWIKQGQYYYRIPVARQGIYKLTYDDLQNAGVPVGAIDPRLIQIFHRGKEQSIYVQGQEDAVFNPTDYIEFFGQANDGTLDKGLYKPGSLQPHNYYNLNSDTTAYFLTWNFAIAPGKRVEAFDELNVTNIPKDEFHTDERLLVNKSEYAPGRTSNDVIQYTHFDQGEGWTGTRLQPGQSIDYTIDQIKNTVITMGVPQLEILLVGLDDSEHTATVFIGPNTSSLRSLGSYTFSGFESFKIISSINWSDLGGGEQLVVRLSASAPVGNRPQFSTSYIKLTYPQNFQSAGILEKVFILSASALGKSYVEFENAPANFRLWDITDPTSITTIKTRISGSKQTAVIGNTFTARKLFSFTSTIKPTLSKVQFRLIDPLQAQFVIISNRLLMKPAGAYADPVKAYAGYRASPAGGGYDTLVVPIDLLYNQFNYGETSPMAIYEFMRYLTDKGNPEYLFLIGKGRDVNSGYHRITNPGTSVLKDLVPSAGMPGSDMNYTVGLKGTTYEPAVPTGRLTATSANQVAAYLNKIKEFEATPAGAAWQKNGLHLSGGIFPAELPTFRNYVDGFKAIGEGEFWGSAIKTIAKREPSQVELINISDEINSGVNLVTFFGHSSAGTIDIDIGYVSDPVMGYDNPSRYPVFLINGCNAGSFFLNGVVFGEDWINTSNKGARNFIAHSSFGFTNTLQYYSNLFYSIGFADSTFIEKGIGDIQKEVARVYMQTAAATIQNITQVQQMMLLGDPAVKLFTASKPDYQITNNDISLFSFDNKPVTTLTDSFALKLVVKNLGLAKPKPLKIEVLRTLTNGSTLRYDSLYGPVNYADTLLFTIRQGNELSGGNNSFRVVIDPDNNIDELIEDNNEATLNAFIASNATLNLFPFNYAIVNQTQVSLTWHATDPLSDQREFQIEMDTTLSFNSGYLKKKVVSGKVLASAQFDLLETDSTVYYWRTRFDKPESNESGQWQVSSFSYIENSGEGWAQLRKNQLKDNFFSGMVDQGEGKPFTFEEQVTQIDITTYGSNHPSTNTDVSVKINGAEYNLSTQGQPCRDNTINLVAFNKSTAVPYAAIPFIFQDPRTCGREPQLINSFRANELETGLFDDMIEVINRIAVSDSVVLFSIGDAGFNLWSNEVKLKLGEIGVSLSDLNDLQPGEPIIIYGRKGASPGTATLIRSEQAPVNEQVVTDTRTITGRRTEGLMRSSLIGPAQTWIELQLKNPNLELSDTIKFVIYGVDSAGKETLITEEANHGYDLSKISTSEFPYLRIEYRAEDEINLTPADWINWLVLYEPVAEGILLYDETVLKKSVQEGEPWSSAFRFINISKKNFNGPLLVEVEIYSKELQTRSFYSFEIDSPTPGESALFDVTSSTLGKAGANDISVMVNNRIKPEQYYDNNIVSMSDHLFVIADKTAPVLDVTFNGRVLSNGDYTSSNPAIEIVLKDENEFLLKTDTLGMHIFLGTACNQEVCVYKRIPFSSSQIKWYAATNNTDFKVTYNPVNLSDGLYGLKVEAADASGNLSGSVPYEILFNVKTQTSLTFNGVYPNPSSLGFFFNFQLTGNELPDKFLLEIFSSTGQLVTKFNEDDANEFYIGTNELIWDGTDSSGVTLSNGIYLYRLTMQVNGLEKIESGKLVLVK